MVRVVSRVMVMMKVLVLLIFAPLLAAVHAINLVSPSSSSSSFPSRPSTTFDGKTKGRLVNFQNLPITKTNRKGGPFNSSPLRYPAKKKSSPPPTGCDLCVSF